MNILSAVPSSDCLTTTVSANAAAEISPAGLILPLPVMSQIDISHACQTDEGVHSRFRAGLLIRTGKFWKPNREFENTMKEFESSVRSMPEFAKRLEGSPLQAAPDLFR